MSPRSRKRRLAFRKRSARRKPGQAHNIPSFCVSNDISESEYFKLKREGKGPREIKLGKRTLITPEAEQDWRCEREAETMAQADHPKLPRDGISSDNTGEIKRISVRNEELENENTRLQGENLALRSKVEELKARLATTTQADDGLDIPASLRRASGAPS
jgi:hypothetical protein